MVGIAVGSVAFHTPLPNGKHHPSKSALVHVVGKLFNPLQQPSDNTHVSLFSRLDSQAILHLRMLLSHDNIGILREPPEGYLPPF